MLRNNAERNVSRVNRNGGASVQHNSQGEMPRLHRPLGAAGAIHFRRIPDRAERAVLHRIGRDYRRGRSAFGSAGG
jgi:hypothetical protein